MAYDARLMGDVLNVFVRAVFGELRRHGRELWSVCSSQCGAVTFVQRYGDALNANVHFHCLVIESNRCCTGEGLELKRILNKQIPCQRFNRQFRGEKIYHTSKVDFLGFSWEMLLAVVNDTVYKIAPSYHPANKNEANRLAGTVSRITGFSVPVFGVSWNPPQPEIAIVRKVLAFLEDRRVLYNPYHIEVEHECIQSVLDIRRFLTEDIGALSSDSKLAEHLRAIRAACRNFLDEANPKNRRIHDLYWNRGSESAFFTALAN